MKLVLGTVGLKNGEELFYRQSGTGSKPLVLLHGNLSSSIHWLPLLEKLSPQFTAYALDIRGFGESTYNNPIRTIEDISQDLLQFVDALGIESFSLMGWSLGGCAAMDFAARHPQRVENLLLMAPGPIRGLPLLKKGPDYAPLADQYYQTKEEMALDPVQVAPVSMALATQNKALMELIWTKAIWATKIPEQTEAYIEETMKQRNLLDVNWSLALFNISHQHNGVVPGTGQVDKITMPTLVFWGDKDLAINRGMIDELMAGIKTATLIVMEGCGHSPVTDDPERIATEISSFIK